MHNLKNETNSLYRDLVNEIYDEANISKQKLAFLNKEEQ